MALIGKIRNTSWLLIVLIGLGLGGFIFMDMFSGQQSAFGSQDITTMGEIEGRKVNVNNFNDVEQLLYGNSPGDVYTRKDVLWNYFVEEALTRELAEEMGIGISKEELLDLEFGNDLSPVISARFQNPNTRQVDRQQLNQYKQLIEGGQIQTAIEQGQISPNFPYYWAHQENEIITERIKSKINNLVTKAIYTPTWMLEMNNKDQNSSVDFTYVKVPFDEIDNADVALTDADYEAYLKENMALYKQDEETRRVEYVIFDVQPTPEDSVAIRRGIADLIPNFRAAEDDSLFVENNYGSFDAAYVKKANLTGIVADTAFSLPVGSVYGPYMEDGAYKAVKIVDRKEVPDSVRSRHILIQTAGDPTGYVTAQQRVDSLKNLIETNQASFDSLAAQFGSDGTRAKGGDLGYVAPGTMVPEFNNLIFYEAEENKLYTVATQFGVHLVEVTGKKFEGGDDEAVRLAYISQAIVPSEETQSRIYDDVLMFVEKNRDLKALAKAAAEQDLEIATSPALKKNDYVVGALGTGQASRDLIRWAYNPNSEENQVSPDIYIYQDPVELFNNKYVVAGLRSIQDKGTPKLANVKDEIEPQVINRKKAELIKEQIQGKDMNAIASSYSADVDTASNVKFNTSFVPGLGSEPKVIATAYRLNEGDTSSPIVGDNGVYIIKVTRKNISDAPASNIAQLRQTTSSPTKLQVNSRLFQAIRKNADILDNRSRFY